MQCKNQPIYRMTNSIARNHRSWSNTPEKAYTLLSDLNKTLLPRPNLFIETKTKTGSQNQDHDQDLHNFQDQDQDFSRTTGLLNIAREMNEDNTQ